MAHFSRQTVVSIPTSCRNEFSILGQTSVMKIFIAFFISIGFGLTSLTHAPAFASSESAKKPVKSVVVRGKEGQSLSVDRSRNLNRSGTTVVVTGKRFDERVGIYVALCVIPKKGQKPGPCGGGVDTDGSSSASKWISSNPPSYGIGLAQPYRLGGSFKVRLKIKSKIGKVDCRRVKCAITSRADHLQESDRSADVFIPVSFK